jgi:hypothetical protein
MSYTTAGRRIAAITLGCLLTQAALAEDEGPAVPIEKAPFHQPVFKNELVMVLKIDVPRAGEFHGLLQAAAAHP